MAIDYACTISAAHIEEIFSGANFAQAYTIAESLERQVTGSSGALTASVELVDAGDQPVGESQPAHDFIEDNRPLIERGIGHLSVPGFEKYSYRLSLTSAPHRMATTIIPKQYAPVQIKTTNGLY